MKPLDNHRKIFHENTFDKKASEDLPTQQYIQW